MAVLLHGLNIKMAQQCPPTHVTPRFTWTGTLSFKSLWLVIGMTVLTGCATSDTQSTGATAIVVESAHSSDPATATPPSTTSKTNAVYSIDLATALRLAEAENYQIALAEERIVQAKAEMRQAQFLLLPNLSVGASQYYQDGVLQEISGTALDVERAGRMAGLGSGAVGAGLAGTPGVRITTDFSEAIFAPLAARQNAKAAEAESRVVKHQTLLNVVIAYYELLRAKARVSVARDSFQNATELAETTSRFASTGEGLESDAERATVEKLVQERELSMAIEAMGVRSIQLAELLRLSHDTRLDPVEEDVVPVEIMPSDDALERLIATAVENRPEMNQLRFLLKREAYRFQEAQLDPFIPKLSAGFSTGGFGAGAGSSPGDLESRREFGAAIYWELEGLGLSFVQKRKARRSEQTQARLRFQETHEHIIAEVREGVIHVQSRKRQLDLAAKTVEHALRSFTLNRARVFENVGLPIEVLQSIQSLARARHLYVDAVVDYNQSQYRLYTALGQPPGSAFSKPSQR